MVAASTIILFVGTIATATLMPQSCDDGYEVFGANCVDINECKAGDNPCTDANSECSESSTDLSVAVGTFNCA